MKLVVAEKPSVARDLAAVLGARSKRDGALEGNGWIVTWCIGHLVELEEPHAYDPRWKRWSLDTLPMLPEKFLLRPTGGRTAQQWRVVRDLLKRRDFDSVVNACDAGREGELIFRYAYDRAGSRLKVERLWISSLTPAAIQAGFSRIAPGARFEALADAARSRSEADWLMGLNATRALTLARRGAGRGVYSVGRVQTPTLALLVRREEELRAFVPRTFFELWADVEVGEGFAAKWKDPAGSSRLSARPLAEDLERRVKEVSALGPEHVLHVEDVRERQVREAAPQLFDLTTLQRVANQRLGFSAERTLALTQSLYERHKLVTYPRTSSRVLGEDQRAELPGLVAAFAAHPDYGPHAQRLAGNITAGRRVIDDSKVGDHHAIIPTGKQKSSGLDRDEAAIFDLIVRRFLAALHPAAELAITDVVLRAGPVGAALRQTSSAEAREKILGALPPPPDRFFARGRVLLEPGWMAVERGDSTHKEDERVLPALSVGQVVPAGFRVAEGRTQPPRRHTDATLLLAMETAGRSMEDEALREAMKDAGLGTPATRAAIIETLIRRRYVRRERKLLVPTDEGMGLIHELPVPILASAELTGEWEARLSRIARGEDTRAAFMADIHALVRDVVARLAAAPRSRGPQEWAPQRDRPRGAEPERKRPAQAQKNSGRPTGARRARRAADKGEDEPSGTRASERARSTGRGGSAPQNAPDASPAQRRGGRGSRATGDGGAAGRRRGIDPNARGHPSDRSTSRSPSPRKSGEVELTSLVCPSCGRAGLVRGRRAWGCAHWRDGCKLVVPFELDGKALTPAQLRDLITKGKTRKAAFKSGTGRLVLRGGTEAVFEADGTEPSRAGAPRRKR